MTLGMGEMVQIIDYDSAWPVLFERERALIAAALGGLSIDIEHVGSTAVPDLAAKPIIDIAVAIRRLADGERCVRPAEARQYHMLKVRLAAQFGTDRVGYSIAKTAFIESVLENAIKPKEGTA